MIITNYIENASGDFRVYWRSVSPNPTNWWASCCSLNTKIGSKWVYCSRRVTQKTQQFILFLLETATSAFQQLGLLSVDHEAIYVFRFRGSCSGRDFFQ